jgi:hypothetical protein
VKAPDLTPTEQQLLMAAALLGFLRVEVDNCVFPEPGQYNFEVYFAARGHSEVLKGELPFVVVPTED